MQQKTTTSQQTPLFIAIEGCIGVGKTTLTKALTQKLNGNEMLEVVEENPFLAEFYKDRDLLAFKTQMFFLLSRYKQQQALSQTNLFQKSIVSDYFIAKDRIFAELTLKDSEFQLYDQLYNALCQQIHAPNLIIYLRAPLDVILGRIEKRGRSFEKDIDPDYLSRLMQSYDRFFNQFQGCPVLTVETEDLNFPDREEHVSVVMDAVGETLNQKKSALLVNAGERRQQILFS